MSVALSSSDRDVIERTVDVESVSDDCIDVLDVFEVSRCVCWAKEKGLTRVTLQFPDGLLQYAPKVAKEMEERLGQRLG